MKRLLPLLALVALVVTGCSLNEPKSATYVTDVSATLNGSVSSNEAGEVTYWFRYGTTEDYGQVTPDRTVQFPAGHNSNGPRFPVSEPISGLEPNTTYHYQGCASPGIAPGSRACTPQDLTFTTGAPGGVSGIGFSSQRSGLLETWTMDPAGGSLVNVSDGGGAPGGEFGPDWSPDAKRLTFEYGTVDLQGEIWVMDADGGDRTRLTFATGYDERPAWSPDGTQIAFESERVDHNRDIYVMNPDGTEQTSLSQTPVDDELMAAWSPDSRRILYSGSNHSAPGSGTQYDIRVMDRDGTNRHNLTDHASQDSHPAWSPDGRRIAFISNRDGSEDIYVMDADGSNQVALTSTAGVNESAPVWSPDGTRIAYNTVSPYEIYVMNADGTNPTNISNDPGIDFEASWSPRH